VAEFPKLRLLAHERVTGLLRDDSGRVGGIEIAGGERFAAGAVLLSTGGLGQLYQDTTNPAVATGDGVALAYRAGATLADMEFVQFHPTALALAGAPRFLLSEALRGEGAVLRNPAGERFMARYHTAQELAPRDVVARALEMELRSAPAGATCFLDATALPASELARRFPRIVATLAQFGLDLARQPIPVRPAAHYAMGGIWTSLEARSTLGGLFAAGECACTGVHGANRLASNSLLEGLVFGARAGRAMGSESGRRAARSLETVAMPAVEDWAALRRTMSATAGVVRNGPDMEAGLGAVERLGHDAAAAVLRAALARRESRGAHFREDFPEHAAQAQHSFQRRGTAVRLAAEP